MPVRDKASLQVHSEHLRESTMYLLDSIVNLLAFIPGHT